MAQTMNEQVLLQTSQGIFRQRNINWAVSAQDDELCRAALASES
jgi:hypothetical protein